MYNKILLDKAIKQKSPNLKVGGTQGLSGTKVKTKTESGEISPNSPVS